MTAPYDDLQGNTIKYTHEPDIMGQVRKRFIRLVRKSLSHLQDFRYFWSLETTKLGVIHYHLIFNVDVLKSFGAYSQYLCTDKDYALGLKKQPIKGNKSIFYDDYLMHKRDKKGNIKIPQNYYEKKNVCVPKITLLWANAYASVMNKNKIKHYKHLNPISQNIQIFRPSKKIFYLKRLKLTNVNFFIKVPLIKNIMLTKLFHMLVNMFLKIINKLNQILIKELTFTVDIYLDFHVRVCHVLKNPFWHYSLMI
ncbi:rolling circle replication-associated protein [Mulberry dwarf phytoplasma]|uniref:rolling circle replication-associated protein n=1 Tax=Mulberry dwarf phytoplasma TaxID=186171 RepID=UPI001D124052|nr:hypothetical protein [Mulberry dwarf phytoplasma]